jgi:4-oxalocrotonate tautomerase
MYSRIERGFFMPIITVQLLEGRTDEQKRALVEKVTDAVSETTGAPKEIKPNDYGVAGKRPSDQNEQ